jgi:hypothetical protein
MIKKILLIAYGAVEGRSYHSVFFLYSRELVVVI